MKIAIIGLGFVGLSLTSVLASKGFDVVGIDVDKEKCRKISNWISPFFEPDLEKILKNGLKKKLEIKSYFSFMAGYLDLGILQVISIGFRYHWLLMKVLSF